MPPSTAPPSTLRIAAHFPSRSRTGQLVRGCGKKKPRLYAFQAGAKNHRKCLENNSKRPPAAGIRDKNGKNLPPWRISAAPFARKDAGCFQRDPFSVSSILRSYHSAGQTASCLWPSFLSRRDVLSGLTKSNSRSLNEKGQNSLVKKIHF